MAGEEEDCAGMSDQQDGEMIEGYSRKALMEPEIHFADTSSCELHKLLKRVDPDAADDLHPNDKRKIMR
jgi:tRNA A37 N6-isopentenylltransferase MiaA